MKFQVPQFIEVEDRIFGPLTLWQFLYLIGGAGLSVVIFRFVPSTGIAFVLIAPVIIFSLALAFYKINNRPFINAVESAFRFFTRNKLYIWKRENKSPQTTTGEAGARASDALIPRLSNSKLKDLSWTLDIHKK